MFMAQIQNVPPWEPVTGIFSTGCLHRNPEEYKECIKQFAVESNRRYRWEVGQTYCNIFVADCLGALGCPIPHVTELDGPLNANKIADWLTKYGAKNGWQEIDRGNAKVYADVGQPTIAIFRNVPPGRGHIAMVLPTDPNRPGDTLIAQAGMSNFFGEPIEKGFDIYLPQTKFYTHP